MISWMNQGIGDEVRRVNRHTRLLQFSTQGSEERHFSPNPLSETDFAGLGASWLRSIIVIG